MRALLALAAVVAGCGDPDPVTVVLVTVDARPGVRDASSLVVTARNGASTTSESFALGGESFPVTFTITPTGRTGTLELEVSAIDGGGGVRGAGTGAVDIAPDAQVEVGVVLDPTDFVINDAIAGTQRPSFHFEGLGKSLAAAPDGTMFATYVNDCMVLGRCDVLARRFDDTGAPIVNATTMDDGELVANLTQEYTDGPAVAVGADSAMLVWETLAEIKGVVMTADGDHKTVVETVVSTTLEPVRDPAVAAVANGQFIVVWSERRAGETGTSVFGRYIGASGAPAVNPNTNDDGPFQISASATGFAELPHVAAMGPGRGFVAVWRHRETAVGDSIVRARMFGADGAPRSAVEATVSTHTSGQVYGPHVAAVDDGLIAVAYAVESPDDPRTTAGAVVIAYASSPNGTRTGAPIFADAPLESAVELIEPVIAARADRALLAVWHNCGARGDGQGCGVFAQAAIAVGSPIGERRAVNTTLASEQFAPSVTALPDAFAALWADESRAAPDTDGGAVRGRLLYVDIDVADGTRGASCGQPGDAACGEGLVCMPGSAAPRCHDACDPAAALPCPGGGICTTVADESACVF